MSSVLPVAEISVINWALSLSSITSLVGLDNGVPSISSQLPETAGTSMPWLVVASVPGGLELNSGEGAALEDIIIQFDAFAPKKPAASVLIQTVLAEVRAYGVETLPDNFGGAFLVGMRKINGPRPLWERDHEWVRFTADIVATTKPEVS